MKKKIIIDILLFILILLEYSKNYMSTIIHEIIGILIALFLILHILLNIKYIKNIPKGKYNNIRLIILIINVLFMMSMSLTLIFGITSSQVLFNFNTPITIIKLHKIFSYISLILLGIHLGINIQPLLNKVYKKINKNIYNLVNIIIIIYGIYIFVKLDIINKILGNIGFSVYEGNIFINTFNYLIIILMIISITNYIYKLIKHDIINNKER